MNKDQVKGAIKEAAGTVQKKTGELTGNGTQQVKGAAREAAGAVQKKTGDVKEAVKPGKTVTTTTTRRSS